MKANNRNENIQMKNILFLVLSFLAFSQLLYFTHRIRRFPSKSLLLLLFSRLLKFDLWSFPCIQLKVAHASSGFGKSLTQFCTFHFMLSASTITLRNNLLQSSWLLGLYFFAVFVIETCVLVQIQTSFSSRWILDSFFCFIRLKRSSKSKKQYFHRNGQHFRLVSVYVSLELLGGGSFCRFG